MYRATLEEKLQRIFGIERVSFDLPSDQYEQDRLFVEVSESSGNVGGGRALYMVSGACFIFSRLRRVPHGFFSRQIGKASPDDLNDFFFFPETTPPNSQARVLDLIESRIAFTFLFKAEIDPNQGQITSVEGLSNG